MCPKCKAKIGLVQERIYCDAGLGCGRICYMCGFWIQDHHGSSQM